MNHEHIYGPLGERIRSRRKRLGFTQLTLAPLIGISRASLASIETGRQNVLVHQLYAFAEALELRPADLLPPVAMETGKVSGLPMPSGLNSEQKKQISRLIGDADPAVDEERERIGTQNRK